MKRAIVFLTVLCGVALVAGMTVPSAQASCANAKLVRSGHDGGYNYVVMPAPASAANNGSGSLRIGHFWALADSTSNDGSFGADNWWVNYLGTWGVDVNLTGPGIAGCPVGELAITFFDKDLNNLDAYYAVAQVPDVTACAYEYDLAPASVHCAVAPGTWGNIVGKKIPRPRVTASSRVGSQVNLTLRFDDVGSGAELAFYDGNRGISPYSVITGHQVFVQSRPKASVAPTRDRADGWGAVAASGATTLGGTTGVTLPVTCPDTASYVYVAAGLTFNSGTYAAGSVSPYLSAPTRVECNPALADPNFKIIDKTPRRPVRDR